MSEITSTPIDQIISIRKDKIEKLRAAGINPYPAATDQSAVPVEAVHAKYSGVTSGDPLPETVSVNGRLVSRREMGKAAFADLRDVTGKIQLYFKADAVGLDSFKIFKDAVDISDFIGVTGSPFRTRTGELSLLVKSWTFLSKSLRPLPEKFHGLKDVETRYRQRYLDLLANPEVKDIFIKRNKIIGTIRKELESRRFVEVETPLMQVIAGGAAACPFTTHHNALDLDLFMRIAPELYLKRLVSGGLERVFEIGRNFRNEGIDRNHNPEFTMLELYQAYAGYEQMMDLAEALIASAAREIGAEIKTPFRRARLFDLLKEHTGVDVQPLLGTPAMRDLIKQFSLDVAPNAPEKKILDHLFDATVVGKLTDPTFVYDYPSAYSPLAKARHDQPAIAERFELYINGMEIANAYSELNDPQVQKRNFEDQMEAKRKGEDETEPYDADYIVALEHGLPPTGGLGIGIDRLVMVLGRIDSIREVILFPLMRPE